MVNHSATKDMIQVPKREYLRLKAIEKQANGFFKYIEHITDIKSARAEVKKGKLIPQEELFEKLGI